MANLHGFREYDQPVNQQKTGPNIRDILGEGIKRFPIIGAQVAKTNPRQMHYFEMLQNNLCPGYRIMSVTTLVIFAYTLLFVLCILDGIEKQGQLLEISEASLINKGGLQTNQIKNNFMFQQLFTSIFLSRDFYQYVTIVVSLLIFLSSFEFASGPLVALSLYVFSGALGALFGSSINCCTDQVYLHATTSIYGMVGAFLGVNFRINQCIILNWNALDPLQEVKAFLCCFMWILATLFLVITISSPQSNNHSDKYGSIGGFLTGFILCLAIVPPMQQGSYEDKASVFGWTFLGIFASISALMIIVI